MSGRAEASVQPASLRERALALRDRLTASPAFRAWAARFPLTRPIARRRARALFDLNAGFVYSQILSACVRLDLFERLRAGPRTPAQLAPALGLTEEGALRLLEAAAALNLAAKRGPGGAFGLGELGAALLDNPGVTAMVRHHALLYADLADPVALLRARGGGKLAEYWAYAGNDAAGALDAERVAEYSALMAASQPMIAEEVLGAVDFRRHRALLDVGGGEGAFLCAVAEQAPDLRLLLFDLPAVAERARARFAREGLSARATTFGGSFHDGALPGGADILSFVRVLHDHDDAAVREMLRRAHAALPAGGTLLVAEPMSGAAGAEPVGEAYFGFYLLAMGRGRPRTPAENGALIEEAGFRSWRQVRTHTPLLTAVILATK